MDEISAAIARAPKTKSENLMEEIEKIAKALAASPGGKETAMSRAKGLVEMPEIAVSTLEAALAVAPPDYATTVQAGLVLKLRRVERDLAALRAVTEAASNSKIDDVPKPKTSAPARRKLKK